MNKNSKFAITHNSPHQFRYLNLKTKKINKFENSNERKEKKQSKYNSMFLKYFWKTWNSMFFSNSDFKGHLYDAFPFSHPTSIPVSRRLNIFYVRKTLFNSKKDPFAWRHKCFFNIECKVYSPYVGVCCHIIFMLIFLIRVKQIFGFFETLLHTFSSP